MKTQTKTGLASILAIVLATAAASAQQAPSPPPSTPYGPPIGLEAAKKVMAAAEAESVKNNWGMAIAILDSTGHIVMLHKLDNTQYGSIAVAEDKARSALYYRRPSKVFEDLVAQGGLGMRTLALRGATPLEGGIPLIADGKIIGAIGASGATSVQDGEVTIAHLPLLASARACDRCAKLLRHILRRSAVSAREHLIGGLARNWRRWGASVVSHRCAVRAGARQARARARPWLMASVAICCVR